MKSKHYFELDGIRAIAALMVIFFHFFSGTEGTGFMKFVQKTSVFGQTGVTLFFVLSGFLITRILIATKKNSNYFSSFYIRRALRIFPLYYFVLVCLYFVVPFVTGSVFVPLQKQVSFWTYLQNFAISFRWNQIGPNHFWSLAIEEQFYLFWPLTVYLLSLKRLKQFIFVICGFVLLLRVVLVLKGYDVFYNTFTRIDALAIGAYLSIIELKEGLNKNHSRKYLIGLIFLFSPLFLLWTLTGGVGNIYIQICKDSLLALAYFCLIGYSLSISANSIFKKILLIKPLNFTGRISYGLYVYHPFCFHFMFYYFETKYVWVNFFLGTTLCFAVAALSFYLFESRFLRLKKHFTYTNKPKKIYNQSQVILES